MDELVEKFIRCPECRSFSVKQVKPDLKERAVGKLLENKVFYCENCSHRYIQFSDPAAPKKKSTLFLLFLKKGWLVLMIPLVIIGIVLLVAGIAGDNTLEKPQPEENAFIQPENKITVEEEGETSEPEEKEEIKPIEQAEVTEPPPEKVEDEGVEEKAIEPDQPPPQVEEKKPVQPIHLGSRKMFGVNWVAVEKGVQITKLSNGPLKKAGILIGDIIHSLDDQFVGRGGILIRTRNDIIDGKRGEAIIKVFRGDEEFLYKMVGSNPKPQPKTEPEVDESLAEDPSPPQMVKVFEGSSLKVRKSCPDMEENKNRWRFLKKTLTLKRDNNQKVFIAGDKEGQKRWGVDDHLFINGRKFVGLADSLEENKGYIPYESKLKPLDITHLIDPGKDVTLKIELVDHGIYFGNTDIYLVVR